jgi:hypothetical protein
VNFAKYLPNFAVNCCEFRYFVRYPRKGLNQQQTKQKLFLHKNCITLQMGTMRAELIGLALRVRTLAAEDVVFIYAEPDHADLDQLLKGQLYRSLLAEILCQADRQTVYEG